MKPKGRQSARKTREETGKSLLVFGKKNNPLDLLEAAGKLKTIKRSGWVKKAGIIDAESVADHSFRMAILGAYISDIQGLDSAKVMRMCLIHDLAESKIGDLMPEDKVSEEDHRRTESNVVRRIFSSLPSVSKINFLADWNELMEMKTKESRLVWQIDKLEMGLTMKDYLSLGHRNLSEFDPSELLLDELRRLLEAYGKMKLGQV